LTYKFVFFNIVYFWVLKYILIFFFLFLIGIEIFIGIFFLFDYMLGLYLAKKKCNYLFSLISLVDIVTIVPLFIDLVVFFSNEQREAYTIVNVNGTHSLTTADGSGGSGSGSGSGSGGVTYAPSPSSSSMLPGTIGSDGVTRSQGLTPYNFAVFRVTRVLRALRVLRAWKAIRFGTLGISINAFKTIFTIVTLGKSYIFVFFLFSLHNNILFHEI